MDDKELRQITGQFMELMLGFYCRFQEFPISRGKFRLNSLSFHVLFRLYMDKSGTLSVRELTPLMQISKPQLIKLVNRLEDEKLVIRKRMKENRRVVYLSLSEEGTAYIRQMLHCMEDSFMETLAGKDIDKIASFSEGVRKITEAMGP